MQERVSALSCCVEWRSKREEVTAHAGLVVGRQEKIAGARHWSRDPLHSSGCSQICVLGCVGDTTGSKDTTNRRIKTTYSNDHSPPVKQYLIGKGTRDEFV